MSAARFTIAIPDRDLEYLQQKLALSRFPDELENPDREYGAPLADIRRLVNYWKDGYSWRKAEAALNTELPMFTHDIEVEGHGTLNVHYVHQKSRVAKAIPLLFVHGWPGSFIEVRKILPLLTTPSAGSPAFHVVCLGLPGFGFSEAPRKKGFGPIQYAEVGHKLMLSVGYDKYVTQGGDWGSSITRITAAKYGPRHAKAWHTNLAFDATKPTLFNHPLLYLAHMFQPYSASDREILKTQHKFDSTGWGYFQEQSTKPQTVGYSLGDSPVSLLAWIYEKLVDWTDQYPWSDDEVLTWVSIYWFSRAGPAASVRIYYEHRISAQEEAKLAVTVPVGLSQFPRDIKRVPSLWARTLGNLVQEIKHKKGGHFAAYEVPELLVSDLHQMFGKQGPAYGVVDGNSGYP